MRRTTAERFMYGFWKLRQHFVCRVNPQLRAEHGLELPELFLLRYIAESDFSPGEIAEAMNLPPHAVSRRLEALERGGYITRGLDPQDARRRVLSATPAGEALLRHALSHLDEAVSRLLERLEPAERSRLIDLLERLTASEELP